MRNIMARPIMWLKPTRRAGLERRKQQIRDMEKGDVSFRKPLLRVNDVDADDDRTNSNASLNELKQPVRSYRCQTNLSSITTFGNINLLEYEKEKKKKDRSLFIFAEDNIIRKSCKRIVENKVFEYFMLLTIAANCVVLMIATPLPNDDTSTLNKRLDQGDSAFVAVFVMEAVLKIIAYGFILHEDAYLKSGWNILDFIVVVVGLVQVLTALGDSSASKHSEAIRALRAVRVLRPLKLVSGVPSLQVLMKSLIRAMVPLLQILLLVLFVIIIYSIVGLELLRGRYHYTCFSNETGQLILPKYSSKPRPCDYTIGWGRKCNNGETCRRASPEEWSGPNNGITTFDNMFLSMLTVFQCITLEGWSEILYLTMDSRDRDYPIVTWSAFILLIVVGSFFMLNLVLGVLSGEFAKERERVENRKSFLKLRKLRQIERQVDHYLHWISKAEIIDDDDNDNDDDNIEGEDNITGNENVIETDDNGARTGATNRIKHCNNTDERTKRGSPKSKKKRKCISLHKMERKFRVKIRHLIKSKVFYWLVLLLVFLNTVSMSFNHYGQDEEIIEILDITELVFTTTFFVEMLLRIFGLGYRDYFRSAFNVYDFIIVWLSIADLLYKHLQNTGSIGVSVLRSVRLLRIFKVTRFWSSMQNVISSLMNSIRSILSLILLLLLFIFIFALLGMQLFGGQFHSIHKGKSRTSFDNFPKAMLAVFQIMTGEDWNSVMYRGITAFGGPKSVRGMLASLYFISLVILGNYTLLNVFLAIAVDNLANAQVLTKDEEEELRRAEEQKRLLNIMFSPIVDNRKQSKWTKVRSVPKMLMFTKQKDHEENPFKGITYKGRPPNLLRARSESDSGQQIDNDILQKTVLKAQAKFKNAEMPESPSSNQKIFTQWSVESGSKWPIRSLSNDSETSNQKQTVTVNQNANATEQSESTTDLPLNLLPLPGTAFEFSFNSKILRRRQLTSTKVINTRSLFLFSPSSRIRTWCHKLVNMKHFEHIMLFFILLSSLCLALEDPRNSQSETNRMLYFIDIGFVTIFTFEIIVKLIDQGAVLHKGSFLRDWWNVIDTLVVTCNIAATVLMLGQNEDINSTIGESTLKAMRILRVFRPLRVVNKLKGLKVVFQCVVFSLKRVLNIIIIAVLCLFMFAVIGVHLFQGKFHYCTDSTKLTAEECQGHFYYFNDPVNNPDLFSIEKREWKNYPFHFDHVLRAMLTLFSCGTGEGWPIVMEKSIDATKMDEGPIPDNNMFMSLYYVCFVVIFSFFFLNIFVALIIVTFQEQGEKEITGCELDKNQRACLHFVLNAKPRQRFMPQDKSGLSYKIWRVVDSKPFEIVIMTLIAGNAIVLMLSEDEQNKDSVRILVHVNLAFTFIFTLEAMLKLMAYKLNYFRDSWNVFDFCIVLVTLVGAIINITNKDFPIDPSFFRLFRAFRLLKLLRQGYNIRILLWTFLQSLRALPYVVLLIAMLFFIYAIIGMQLFSKVALDNRRQINEYNNFQGFLSALGVLFRCGTGEAWHLVMLDCFDHALCYNDNNLRCGSTVASVIYFCSFYFFYAFLLLNLFVAVIMDNFDYLTRDESILGPHHMDEFMRVWSEYDPSAAGRIPHEDIYQLMCDMQPPVGFGKKCPRFLAYKRLMKLNMPISGDNTVSFTPTIFALVRTSLNMTHHEKECFRDNNFRKIIKRIWPNATQKTLDMMMPEQTVLSGQQITIGKIYAAKLIYESFKEIKRRKNCTLPQFEMFEATHRRGNSFFRKMMGVLRTSSQPLVMDKALRPREEYLTQRRRSNTFSNTSTHEGLKEEARPSVRGRSVSTVNRPVELFAPRIRKNTLPLLHHNFSTQSMEVIRNESVIPRKSTIIEDKNDDMHEEEKEEEKSDEEKKEMAQVLQNKTNTLTDSLITALRDPAKPILCFVNPQIHREDNRGQSDAERENNSARTNENNLERRHSNPRMRQKRVTVSLPMIQLEIPVERDSDFIDIGSRHRNSNLPNEHENIHNDVPDLIKSTQRSRRPGVHSRSSSDSVTVDVLDDINASSSSSDSEHKSELESEASRESTADDSCSSNRSEEILRELNNHLNKAMSDGVQPHWIYKINEDDEDTWC
ncbi:voltage-dependent L-type calcium channel subunit alpha-1S-like isoform X2 [Hydractinia symbiolongicarpus]|uniref:voltage-dependent L-type calcium channel subunit alpha-1S-like isoform X2 n=1 Tax=Hydractinia symbiolongicarpus TaxID=13093 RepID=UPI0025510497|nr:voltage-dependent L-type calcium channel subunit alpha-1S-like isoform X2 [Hydractinia symbiolongicarpus]